MRLVFAGTPEVALPALAAIQASRHEIVAVLTRPDARSGRGRKVVPSPVAEWAQANELEVLRPASANDPTLLDRLRELAPDCCPVVAYGALIPRAALDIPAHGWVNVHFSTLPAWRGAAPVQHAIRAGDDVTGATTFRLVEELDAGPVYGMLTEGIGSTDTAGNLLERLSRGGAQLLVDTLDGIEDGTLEPRPQPGDGVTYAEKITVDDAQIDWSVPAFAVDRMIRSCTPAPGAWTTFRGERLKVGPVEIRTDEESLPPGALQVDKSSVRVGTGSTPVRLATVQPTGKRHVDAADWARGVRPDAEERLGS